MIAQAISDDAGHQVNDKVGYGTVPGMFNLAQVFQFVKDRLDQSPTAQNGFLKVGARHGLHVLPNRCNESSLINS